MPIEKAGEERLPGRRDDVRELLARALSPADNTGSR